MRRRKERLMFMVTVIAVAIVACSTVVNICFGTEDSSKFPTRPITLIVPWPPGGGADLACRKIAELAEKVLNQKFLVLNKAGGAGVIGTAALASAEPDGYTIGLLTATTMVITPHLRSVPYDTTKDFTFIVQIAEQTMPWCVRADARWPSFKAYIEEARKNPGKLTFSTAGPLSQAHVFVEEIAAEEGVKITHIPVQGDAELLPQLLGGHVDAGVSNAFVPHVTAGKLRALGLACASRIRDLPDVPTFGELGYKAEMNPSFGLGAPKGVDALIVKKLVDAFKRAWDDPSFKEFEPTVGHNPVFRDSEAFKQFVLKEFEAKRKVLKQLNVVK